MTKYSLRTRILIYTLVPTFVVALILTGYFTYRRVAVLEQTLSAQAKESIELLKVSAQEMLEHHDKIYLENYLETLQQLKSPQILAISVFDTQHHLVATSNRNQDPELLRLNAQEHPLPVTRVAILEHGLIVRTPLRAMSDTTPSFNFDGYLVIHYNKESLLLKIYQDMFIFLGLVFAGLLTIVLFVSHLLRGISDPLDEMVSTVNQIGAGNFDARIDLKLGGELEALKHGINRMAQSLLNNRDEMEQNIEQATHDLQQTMEQLEMQNIELDIAKRRAQEGARIKSEFLANMSHELRTPLNGVLGFTRQLLKSSIDEYQKDYLLTIEHSAERLLSIINNILDFSKLEERKLILERIPFSLRDTLDDVMALLGDNAKEKQLELTLDIDATTPDHLYGDPLRLQQVMTNLISNAIKFTETGYVAITLTPREGDDSKIVLNCCVEDSGIGISTEQQKMLFAPFHQADGSISRRYGGTGLGLVITKKLVENMGGNIGIDSILGSGTKVSCQFTFEIAPPLLNYPNRHPSLKGQLAWVYDPSPRCKIALLNQLNAWGIEAQSLELAQLKTIADKKPGVIFVAIDHVTPLKEILNLLIHTRTPHNFVLLFDSGITIPKEQLHRAGFNYYLQKPLLSRPLLQLFVKLFKSQTLPTSTNRRLPLHALVVDDNAANLKLMELILSERIEQTTSAQDGFEAVTLTEKQRFDIIFMDIQMPGLDGVSTMSAIRKQGLNKETPIVAVTAHASSDERLELMNQGMNGYLTKPINEEELDRYLSKLTPQKPIPSQSHIDWEQALKLAFGREELAREILQLFIDSFAELRTTLVNDLEALGEEPLRTTLLQQIHKLHGGAAYCGVPQLQKLLADIEGALKAGNSPRELEPELSELEDRLNGVEDESQRYLAHFAHKKIECVSNAL